jgi:MFS family permease
MHDDAFSPTPPQATPKDITDAPPDKKPTELTAAPGVESARLTGYHWFVLLVAILGWLFDTMDQQLFTLARLPAMKQLLPPGQTNAYYTYYGGIATAVFLVGWALGGLGFGVLGDRIGRARTMLLTILVYSLFTGLSFLSFSFWDFAAYRFLTGLGVGGEFAVGVALVAEVWPERLRPTALGWLQACSAIGNIAAAFIYAGLNYMPPAALERLSVFGLEIQPWRVTFLVGVAPALLTLLIMARLREPERWKAVAVGADLKLRLGSYRELFGDPRRRRNALAGLGLAFAGVVGLWGIGFFSYELVRFVLPDTPETIARSMGLEGWTSLDPYLTQSNLVGLTSFLQNLGGFLGIQAFLWFTQRTSRRLAFGVSFVLALASTAFTFWFMGRLGGVWDVLWMIPLMGFCQLTLFGGYAIYFPELFPTRLRSTGTSFCYNVGRLVAAGGPLTLGAVTAMASKDYNEPLRYAGVVMSAVFLLGLIALPFAPETKGRPLPE